MTQSARTHACALLATLMMLPAGAWAEAASPLAPSAMPTARDGRHDFDFLIGVWSVRVRKLVNPLTGSTSWIEYRGTAAHRKLLDSDANLEDFDVETADKAHAIHGETLRLYNPVSGQWSIYLLNLAKGVLSMPPVVGRFTDGRGEFIDQEEYKGRTILVRYKWDSTSPTTARMQQSFSDDGGKTWEVNWITEMFDKRP